MNTHPLLDIIQELKSKELYSLDEITEDSINNINNTINMVLINCVYSLLELFYNIEKTHRESEDGLPDLSRVTRNQLNFIQNMQREDLNVINEYKNIVLNDYIKGDNKLISLYINKNNSRTNLILDFSYVYYILDKVKKDQFTKGHAFNTETIERVEKIFRFFSIIVKKICNCCNTDLPKGSNYYKKSVLCYLEEDVNLDEDANKTLFKQSFNKEIVKLLDSIEYFITMFNNHVYIIKIKG